MKYIFPRQFGLHNAFTSTPDSRETVQPFKDYTLREQEIARKYRQASLKSGLRSNPSASANQRLPKRLRGAVDLVKKLQILHSRCSYKELLEHYCPLKVGLCVFLPYIVTKSRKACNHRQRLITGSFRDEIGPRKATEQAVESRSYSIAASGVHNLANAIQNTSIVTFATPISDVSAFCRATISKLVPDGFWGEKDGGAENKAIVMQNIDRFVYLRRFETVSLHLVSQGLKVPSWWKNPKVWR